MIIRNKTVCCNGIRLSIQASEFHYCTPRDNKGPYTKVEVGYIEQSNGSQITPPETWKEYADGDFPSDIYGYIPVSLVTEFINLNGGIDIGKSL